MHDLALDPDLRPRKQRPQKHRAHAPADAQVLPKPLARNRHDGARRDAIQQHARRRAVQAVVVAAERLRHRHGE